MREINIKLTEKLILDYTGYTVEQLADANGYQTVVTVPESELPAQVETQVENPITKEIETVLDYPEGTEFTKPNPETRVQFLGRIGVAALVKTIAEPLRKRAITEAQRQAEAGFSQALQMVIDRAEVNVIE